MTRFCKTCHQSNQNVRFPPSGSLCVQCKDDAAEAKARRMSILRPNPIAVVPMTEPDDDRQCASHRAWVRNQHCVVLRVECSKTHHAHHVRTAATAGTGMKPPDADCVCLCAVHHSEGHRTGWQTFQTKYGVDLQALAADYARRSPFLQRRAA